MAKYLLLHSLLDWRNTFAAAFAAAFAALDSLIVKFADRLNIKISKHDRKISTECDRPNRTIRRGTIINQQLIGETCNESPERTLTQADSTGSASFR